jgi:hemerythrin-like domain-containing protein
MSIDEFLTQDHLACDQSFAVMEGFIAHMEYQRGRDAFTIFANKLLYHFDREEKILFPSFEVRSKIVDGPTHQMKQEHDEMRHILKDMDQALTNENQDALLDLSEMLMSQMQQHNLVEEQMLYQLINNYFGSESILIVNQMQSLEPINYYK